MSGAELTHDEVRAALAAEALGALDGPEREQVRAHLAGCAECRAELESLREAAGALAFAAPHRPMEPGRSARVRERLLARAAAERGDSVAGGSPVDASPPPSPSPREADVVTPIGSAPSARRRGAAYYGWLAAAASLVLFVAAAAWAAREAGRTAALRDDVARLEVEKRQLAASVGQLQSVLDAMGAREMRVISMGPPVGEASGRMFWNTATDQWLFFAHNLPRPPQGRTYQLWLVTRDERTISAGTFEPAPGGRAAVSATYALSPDSLATVAVTEEPAGGVPEPTGRVVIAGSASG